MNNLVMLAFAMVAGFLLGIVFFTGLWWTVRKGISSKSPALWFLASMFLRMSLLVTGFYIVGHGDWLRLTVCLVGFIIARLFVMRLNRAPLEHPGLTAKEGSHAA